MPTKDDVGDWSSIGVVCPTCGEPVLIVSTINDVTTVTHHGPCVQTNKANATA